MTTLGELSEWQREELDRQYKEEMEKYNKVVEITITPAYRKPPQKWFLTIGEMEEQENVPEYLVAFFLNEQEGAEITIVSKNDSLTYHYKLVGMTL